VHNHLEDMGIIQTLEEELAGNNVVFVGSWRITKNRERKDVTISRCADILNQRSA